MENKPKKCFQCGAEMPNGPQFWINTMTGERHNFCSLKCSEKWEKISKITMGISRKSISLTTPLTVKEKQELFSTLFGFTFTDENRDGHFVLYDDEGYEFYGPSKNLQFAFITLADFFSYTAHRAKLQGYADAQYSIRKAIGIK